MLILLLILLRLIFLILPTNIDPSVLSSDINPSVFTTRKKLFRDQFLVTEWNGC